LVNFDIPFNPSRLEQRIGRIDRYGQNFAPEVYHFAPDRASCTTALTAGSGEALDSRRRPCASQTVAPSSASPSVRATWN